MVIAARREKRGLCAVTLLQIKAHDVAVERDGAVEVGDAEVNMPDGGSGIGFVGHGENMAVCAGVQKAHWRTALVPGCKESETQRPARPATKPPRNRQTAPSARRSRGLEGGYSARWQATRAPLTRRNSGRSDLQRSTAIGQRG